MTTNSQRGSVQYVPGQRPKYGSEPSYGSNTDLQLKKKRGKASKAKKQCFSTLKIAIIAAVLMTGGFFGYHYYFHHGEEGKFFINILFFYSPLISYANILFQKYQLLLMNW